MFRVLEFSTTHCLIEKKDFSFNLCVAPLCCTGPNISEVGVQGFKRKRRGKLRDEGKKWGGVWSQVWVVRIEDRGERSLEDLERNRIEDESKVIFKLTNTNEVH